MTGCLGDVFWAVMLVIGMFGGALLGLKLGIDVGRKR